MVKKSEERRSRRRGLNDKALVRDIMSLGKMPGAMFVAVFLVLVIVIATLK